MKQELKRIKKNTVLSAAASSFGRWATASGVTVALMILTFISDRFPHSFGNEDMSMKKMRLATMIAGHSPRPLDDDILAVNIAYDRQLTPFYDEYGLSCGEIDVTDRHKLAQFLSLASKAPYKAIAIDVFFNESIPAVGDSLLFQLINQMPHVVVPSHAGEAVNPMISTDRLGAADYDVNLMANNFSKYCFMRADGVPSIANRLFDYLGSESAYCSTSCMILPINVELSAPYDPTTGTKTWYNLGADILDCLEEKEIAQLCKDKIIIIGDYTESDMHDSYIGEVSGPVIHINALSALREGRVRINFWSVILSLAVYFSLSVTMVFGKSIWTLIGWQPSTFLCFILNFFGFETLLSLLQILQFFLFNEFHDTLLVSLFLSGFSIYCQKLNSSDPV